MATNTLTRVAIGKSALEAELEETISASWLVTDVPYIGEAVHVAALEADVPPIGQRTPSEVATTPAAIAVEEQYLPADATAV